MTWLEEHLAKLEHDIEEFMDETWKGFFASLVASRS